MPDANQTVKSSDLSEKALLEICRAAEVIACECPGYLARILRQVKAFRHYTTQCVEQFPQDTATHLWLADRAEQAEILLHQTLIELMQREQLIDDSEHILLDKLSERARTIVLKQLGAD